jgi:hypothetical protein
MDFCVRAMGLAESDGYGLGGGLAGQQSGRRKEDDAAGVRNAGS